MSDPHGLEWAYNTHHAVRDHRQIVERWERSAARYRSQARADLGLAYGGGPRHKLDLFWPEHDRAGPIALFIHGGYWQAFDRGWFSHFARGANAHGIPVAVASYALCPKVGLRQIIEDMHACTMWLEAHHARSIVAVGHSSGGHLAASLLAGRWAGDEERAGYRVVRAAVTFSGVFDLAPLVPTSINLNLHLDAHSAGELSPIGWSAPTGTWLSAFVGGDENPEFHHQSQMLVDVWGEHGVHTDLTIVPGANHFTVVEGLADPDSEATEKLAVLCHSLE